MEYNKNSMADFESSRLFSVFLREDGLSFNICCKSASLLCNHDVVEDAYQISEGVPCEKSLFYAHIRNSVTFEAAEIAGRRRKTEVGVINPETETARAAKKMACTDCKTHQNRHSMQVSWCP